MLISVMLRIFWLLLFNIISMQKLCSSAILTVCVIIYVQICIYVFNKHRLYFYFIWKNALVYLNINELRLHHNLFQFINLKATFLTTILCCTKIYSHIITTNTKIKDFIFSIEHFSRFLWVFTVMSHASVSIVSIK